MKKSRVLRDIQEYLRIGDRRPTLLESWLIRAEQHIKELEKGANEQELIIANDRIEKLEAEIVELKKNPQTLLNASEKKIEQALFNVAIVEDYNIGTYIRILDAIKL